MVKNPSVVPCTHVWYLTNSYKLQFRGDLTPLASLGTSTYMHTTPLRHTHRHNLKFRKSTWQDGLVTEIPSMGSFPPPPQRTF